MVVLAEDSDAVAYSNLGSSRLRTVILVASKRPFKRQQSRHRELKTQRARNVCLVATARYLYRQNGDYRQDRLRESV